MKSIVYLIITYIVTDLNTGESVEGWEDGMGNTISLAA